jgi:hypothetical protein
VGAPHQTLMEAPLTKFAVKMENFLIISYTKTKSTQVTTPFMSEVKMMTFSPSLDEQ